MLISYKDPYLALFDLRNTSSQDIGSSAKHRIFWGEGGENKDFITCLRRHAQADKFEEQLHYREGRKMHFYNKGAKEKSPL